MRRSIIILLALLAVVLPHGQSLAGKIQVTVKFSPEEFIVDSVGGITYVRSLREDVAYTADYGLPNLPWISQSVELPAGSRVTGITGTKGKESHRLCQDMEYLSYPVPTDVSYEESISAATMRKDDRIYPGTQFRNWDFRVRNNVGIARFLVSPFRYDAETGNLSFTESMTVELEYEEDDMASKMRAVSLGTDRSHCQEADNLIKERISYSKKIDYALICRDSLATSFRPLVEWKRRKGLHAELISLETILDNYPEQTPHARIKRCVQMLKEDYGLEYLVLGGDGLVFPVMQAYSEAVTSENKNIKTPVPTDLYYVANGGNFYWDANGNGIYGELDDDIEFGSGVSVSRLPVHYKKYADILVNKIIGYEQSPKLKPNGPLWFLTGTDRHGVKQLLNGDSISDSYYELVKFYETSVRPYISDNQRYPSYYTDFYSDDFGEGQRPLRANEFEDHLKRGFSFVYAKFHGLSGEWGLVTQDSILFKSKQAFELVSPSQSIITTDACHTNYFGMDAKYPFRIEGGYENIVLGPYLSLSAAFLNGPNNNVIAYLGSSVEGWGQPKIISEDVTTWRGSAGLHNTIWKNLYTNQFNNLSLGNALREYKNRHKGGFANYVAERRLMMSETLCGDSEMQVYTDRPKYFDDIKLSHGVDGFNVSSSHSGFRCQIGYLNSKGVYEYTDFNPDNLRKTYLRKTASIVVTLPNHVPFTAIYDPNTLRTYDTLYLQKTYLTGGGQFIALKVKIGSDVYNGKLPGNVTFDGGDYVIEGDEVLLDAGTTILPGSSIIIN